MISGDYRNAWNSRVGGSVWVKGHLLESPVRDTCWASVGSSLLLHRDELTEGELRAGASPALGSVTGGVPSAHYLPRARWGSPCVFAGVTLTEWVGLYRSGG